MFAQFNYVAIDFEKFDNNIKSYDSYFIFELINNFEQSTLFNTILLAIEQISLLFFNYSIEYKVIDLALVSIKNFTKIKVININYNEKFESNKRSHVDKNTKF